MFEDALLESGGRLKTHRAATTFASLLMQSALVGLLLLMPLIFTDALPAARFNEKLHVPASQGTRAERPVELVPASDRRGRSEMINEHALRAPTRIPDRIARVVDDAPPSMGPMGSVGVVPGLGSGDRGGVIDQLISGDYVPPPPAVRPPDRRPQISDGVMRGFLLNKVMPEYPRLARITRVQGDVVLFAVIGRTGEIEGLRIISGHPQLRQAAEQAVRQWRYRPYLLNGKPIEVETQITVKFRLGTE